MSERPEAAPFLGQGGAAVSPMLMRAQAQGEAEETAEPDGTADDPPAATNPAPALEDQQAAPEVEPGDPPADDAAPADAAAGEFAILRSPEQMPEPVHRTWRALVDAARSGNIESLRLLIDAQPSPPVFSFGEIDDPIDYLKSLSGDAAGREILAILLEILESGFMHVDRGTPQEMYLWPYFARYPLARLTPGQIVEMFTILTAGDYQDMLSYGAYIFFRVGIGPDGTWHFFVAGD